MREEHRVAITERLGCGAGSGHKVLESLFDHPIVSVHDVMRRTGTTFTAANTLVSRLTEIGVLVEVTGNARNRRFSYDPYVKLFSGDAGG
jgi:ribosomal protein S25